MNDNQIKCPSCGTEISISGALTNQIEQQFEKKYEGKFQKVEADIRAKQALMIQEAEKLKNQKEEINELVARQLNSEKVVLERKIKEQIEKQKALEFEDLKNQITEKDKKLDDSRQTELEFRKRARDLEEKQKNFEIEMLKREASQKTQLEEEISKRVAEDQRLKMAEKEKQMDGMRKTIEELKRKSEVTSQQLQGEVLELEIESTLQKSFPIDNIEAVAKGERGADINQKIVLTTGEQAGVIVWETKRTKHWKEAWVDTIKENQRAISAESAVIISDILPKGVSGFAFYEGVWVCDTKSVTGLATALRHHIIQVKSAKTSVASKDAKMELMHRYLTGTQFVQSVQAMAEVLRDMKTSIQDEKNAYSKIWAKREKQVDELAFNTISVYGSIQGIVGGALPVIEKLELQGGE